MKKKTKWIIGSIISVPILLCLVAFIYFQFFFTLDLFKEGTIKKVNLNGWEKLEKGMSKEKVSELLGKSDSRHGPGTRTIDGEEFSVPEFWEYNWTVGLSLFGETHPKSYIVRFDSDGKLSYWREPKKEEDKTKNPEPKDALNSDTAAAESE